MMPPPPSFERPFSGRALRLTRPGRLTHPLILSCPHSGRDYPPDFIAQSRLDAQTLRRSEDAWLDRILTPLAQKHDLALLEALFPRAWVDVNRAEEEQDPLLIPDLPPNHAPPSPRALAGFGVIPRKVSAQLDLYDHPLPFAEAQARLANCYHPWHGTLRQLIDDTTAAFGHCLVLDCHSMPGLTIAGGRVDFVLGDRFGQSCAPALSQTVQDALRGFTTQRNHPYAGGYITAHYGAPEQGVHLLQIELARPLYMDSETLIPTEGLTIVTNALDRIITALLAFESENF